MMLQNRVHPSGNLIGTKARGAWMGTSGLIHCEGTYTKIHCQHFRGRVCSTNEGHRCNPFVNALHT
jgi:hypothetical protein